MEELTIPAPSSRDARREAAELVSDAQYPEACKQATLASSERETVREVPAVQSRRCTPPPRGLSLTKYSFICRRG